jgi:hypothetical protein
LIFHPLHLEAKKNRHTVLCCRFHHLLPDSRGDHVGISVHRIINSRSDLFLRAKSSTFRIAFPEAGEFTPRQSTRCAKENSSNVWRLHCNRLLSLTTFDGISGLVRIAPVSEPHDINDRCNSPTSLEKTLLPRRAAWNVFAHESESGSHLALRAILRK